MPAVMAGIRVVEVAIYGFVPSAGAVLSDWGADVIKVEHPETGDPMRGLAAWGIPPDLGGVTRMWEIFNRGKRSVGLDLARPGARTMLHRLVEHADVFLTNFLEPARARLEIDVAQIREHNPRIIYARGTGYGPLGPDAQQGGFDGISYWARAGASTAAMPPGTTTPVTMPGPAFGDIQAGVHLAGGIAAALLHRERTGEATTVDVSLFGSGVWAMQAALVGAFVAGTDELPKSERTAVPNPLANVSYRTADGRFIALSMLESDRYWPRLRELVDRPQLDDERFSTAALRQQHAAACVGVLDDAFSERTLAEWEALLTRQEGPWSVIRRTIEVLDDAQAQANGYVQTVHYANGSVLPMVAAPVQFDQEITKLSPAPRHGGDTDEVLMAAGATWDQLEPLKVDGSIS